MRRTFVGIIAAAVLLIPSVAYAESVSAYANTNKPTASSIRAYGTHVSEFTHCGYSHILNVDLYRRPGNSTSNDWVLLNHAHGIFSGCNRYPDMYGGTVAFDCNKDYKAFAEGWYQYPDGKHLYASDSDIRQNTC